MDMARGVLPGADLLRDAIDCHVHACPHINARSVSVFEAVRNAGFGDGEIAEMVAVVCLNLFTNYFNHVAQTDLDFPEAPKI